MGKVTDSLLSGTRGRTGRIVVTNTKGVEISRMRPRRSSRQATPKQQLVKDRFNLALRLIQGYKSMAKIYFGKRNGLRSPYNNAMSNVLKAVEMDSQNLQLAINYRNIEFTRGDLLEVQPISFASESELNITFNWMNNAVDVLDETDQLVIMYAEDSIENAQTVTVQTPVTRADESFSLQVLPKYQNVELHLWMAFISPSSGQASNSVYLGKVLVQ